MKLWYATGRTTTGTYVLAPTKRAARAALPDHNRLVPHDTIPHRFWRSPEGYLALGVDRVEARVGVLLEGHVSEAEALAMPLDPTDRPRLHLGPIGIECYMGDGRRYLWQRFGDFERDIRCSLKHANERFAAPTAAERPHVMA